MGSRISQTAQGLVPASFSRHSIGPIDVYGFVLVAATALLTALLLKGVDLLSRAVFAPLARRTKLVADDRLCELIHRVLRGVVLFGGWFLILSFANLPAFPVDWRTGGWRIYMTCVLVWAGVLVYRALELSLTSIGSRKRRASGRSLLDRSFITLLQNLLRFLVFALVVVTVIQGWGYNAATLLAGIGLGGLAVAFAAQDTIANFFGSLILYTDRPYRIGDWIRISDVDGYVEQIGLRSTRVRQLDKTVAIIPNKLVASERIINLSASIGRRIMFRATFTKDQPVDRIRAAVMEIRELLETFSDRVTNVRTAHVDNIDELNGSIQVIAYSRSIAGNDWREVRQDIILGTLEILAKHGVKSGISEFTANYGSDAAPTQAPVRTSAE
jgi:MscS family membrane protein